MKSRFSFTLFVVIFILIVASLSACQSPAEPVNQTEPASPDPIVVTQDLPIPTIPVESPIPMPTPDEESLRSAIVTALLAITNTQNRMDNLTEIEDGKVNHSVIEFIPPDKKHIVSVEDEVEYIIIADKVYMKTKSSDGWEQAQIAAEVFMGQGEATEQAIGEMVGQVQFVRKDQLEGKPMLVVKYVEITKIQDGELESQVELWIGEEDGLPYKMIKDGKIYSVVNDPQTGESKQEYVNAITTTNFDFDPNFQIEAPIQE